MADNVIPFQKKAPPPPPLGKVPVVGWMCAKCEAMYDMDVKVCPHCGQTNA